MKNIVRTFLIGLCATGLAQTGYSQVIGKSIALVNGDAIYLAEFNDNWEALLDQQKRVAPNLEVTPDWKKEQKKLLLDQMIDEKLLIQEAKRQKIKVQRRQLEEGVRQVKNRFKKVEKGKKPTKEDYERDLTKAERKEFLKELDLQNLTEKQFEAKIEDQLRIVTLTEKEIRAEIPPPFLDKKGEEGNEREMNPRYDKEAKELYKKLEVKYNDKKFKANPDEELDQMVELLKAKLGESVRARHILVRAERDADFKTRSKALSKIRAIKKEIDNGADFVELAKEKSEGPSAKNGGNLGSFGRGQMVPPFEKAAFELPVGGISDVVETEFGYHIIMVDEKKAATRLRYDDIKLDLASYLFQKKGQERYDEYVANLKKKADIKITYDFDTPQDS